MGAHQVMNQEIVIKSDPEELAAEVAQRFIVESRRSIGRTGRFSVALSGGTTPRLVYAQLASDEKAGRVDWDRVHLFWSDERCVPPDDPDSNFRMAEIALLDRVPIPSQNIHRMVEGHEEPRAAAEAYENLIRTFFDLPAGPPSFDLVLLGMGEDGHTASLFPGTLADADEDRLIVLGHKGHWRLSFSQALINEAFHIWIVVCGENKAEIIKKVFRGDDPPETFPVKAVKPRHGTLTWFLDSAAASLLQSIS